VNIAAFVANIVPLQVFLAIGIFRGNKRPPLKEVFGAEGEI
jgi:hypothetical protein